MPTLPNKTQTKSPNPSNPPSRTNSIKKSSSKQKMGEPINKNLPSNPPSRTNSLKGKPSKLKPTNSIKVNSCLFEIQRYENQVKKAKNKVRDNLYQEKLIDFLVFNKVFQNFIFFNYQSKKLDLKQ